MARYDRLTQWLEARTDDAVRLTFSEVESILGESLAASARRHPAFWSSGNHLGRIIAAVGWRASPHFRTGTVEFSRHPVDLAARSHHGVPQSPLQPASHSATPDLILVGCVKSKRAGRHPARTLYVSPLFEGRRERAERAGCPWFILSARYGLVSPNDEIDSYMLELTSLPIEERRAWSRRVLNELYQRFGSLHGKTVEIHAGAAYRDHGLVDGLRSAGAHIVVPLEGRSRGQQLAWYARQGIQDGGSAGALQSPRDQPGSSAGRQDAHGVVEALTRGFVDRTWNLSERRNAPVPGWEALPEYVAAKAIRDAGATDRDVRVFLTLVAALDRARDADQLWAAATNMWRECPRVFDPPSVVSQRFIDLRDRLAHFRVSRRYMPDTAAWRIISEALLSDESPASIRTGINEGQGAADILLRDVLARTPSGRLWFPSLSGPKISAMWVRMLVVPGAARITGLSVVPVAVDVQVRKVSELLALTDTRTCSLDDARPIIQAVWKAGAAAAVGPPGLEGTAAAIDPAVWFFGKWGCTFCERAGRRIPIAPVCERCRLEG